MFELSLNDNDLEDDVNHILQLFDQHVKRGMMFTSLVHFLMCLVAIVCPLMHPNGLSFEAL